MTEESLILSIGSPARGIGARLFQWLGLCLTTRVCRLEVRVESPLPVTPFMVCTNHASHLDSIAVMAALGMPFSSCALLAAEDYFFRNRMRLRALSRVLTLIPIRRQASAASFRGTLEKCRIFFGHGGRVLIAYPEGSRGDGQVLRAFKRGPAAIALALGLPIIPGFVGGTNHILPKGRAIPRPGPIEVHFGRPLGVAADAAESASRRPSKTLTAELESRIRVLRSSAVGEERRIIG